LALIGDEKCHRDILFEGLEGVLCLVGEGVKLAGSHVKPDRVAGNNVIQAADDPKHGQSHQGKVRPNQCGSFFAGLLHLSHISGQEEAQNHHSQPHQGQIPPIGRVKNQDR
jgi:hypothetical protein